MELADGGTEKFKDQDRSEYDDSSNCYLWWSHDYRVNWDDTLVVVRHVASVKHNGTFGDCRTLSGVVDQYGAAVQEYEYEVARYAPGTWRTVKRK